MNKDRLTRLANLLRADAANPTGVKFDLGAWGSSQDGNYSLNCETTACAAGLAVLSGIFKDEGLGYTSRLSPFDRVNLLTPTFEGEKAVDAIVKFFDLSGAETFSIFMPEYYPVNKRQGAEGELAVAERIEHFVRNSVMPDNADWND